MKALVTNHEMWTALCKELDDSISLQHRALEQVNDPVDVYRAQGAVMVLKKLKQLKDEINGSK